MRTPLHLISAAVSAVGLVGLAAPAAASPPTVTTVGSASTTLLAADGQTAFFVDAFDAGASGQGVVDVFGASVECTLPETATPAPASVQGTSSAELAGTLAVECWDAVAQRGSSATIEVDLAWTATGEATRTPLASPRTGCTGFRLTAPAVVTGTVRLSAPDLGLDVSAVPAGRPAEIAQTTSRCR